MICEPFFSFSLEMEGWEGEISGDQGVWNDWHHDCMHRLTLRQNNPGRSRQGLSTTSTLSAPPQYSLHPQARTGS